LGEAPPPNADGFSALSQNTYGAAIETLEQAGKVVDSLYAKVRMRAFPVSV